MIETVCSWHLNLQYEMEGEKSEYLNEWNKTMFIFVWRLEGKSYVLYVDHNG